MILKKEALPPTKRQERLDANTDFVYCNIYVSAKCCPACGSRDIYRRIRVFGVVKKIGWSGRILLKRRVPRYHCQSCYTDFDNPKEVDVLCR